MINIGSKYYKYNKDTKDLNIDLIRVLSINDETRSATTSSGKTIPLKTLDTEYIELLPDAKLDIMITKYENGDPDIYVMVYRIDKLVNKFYDVDVFARQDMYSISKNAFSVLNKNIIYVGDCISSTSNMYNGKLIELADFKEVKSNLTISIYLDDKLNDIIPIVKNNIQFNNLLNKTFRKLYKKNSRIVQGYCSDLEEFLRTNNFIYEYRSIFNIHTINIELDNSSDDIILNDEQKKQIEDMLRLYITDINIIKYDKDIDVSTLIKNKTKHILISDKLENIYLIAYSEIGPYPIEDEDIAMAMGM